MNRIHTLVLVPLLALAACGKKGPDLPPASEFPTPGQPAKVVVKDAATQAAPGTQLRFAPKGEASDEMTMRMAFDASVRASGQSMNLGMDLSSAVTVSTGAVKDDGSFVQKSVTGKSDVKLRGDLASQMGDGSMMSELMEGVATEVTMDPQGRTLGVEMGDGQNPLLSQFGGGFDSAVKNGAVMFPDGPVAVGATWTALTHIDMMGMPIRVATDFKLVALEGTKGKVELAMRGALTGGPASMPNNPSAKLASLDFEASGTVGFDLARPSASTADMKMSLDADIEAMGESGSMTMTATIGLGPKG